MLPRIGCVLVLSSGLLVYGCDSFSPICGGCHFASQAHYSLPTAPESLITNLQVSYRNREIEHYAQILAPEFIFHLQPVDGNQIGTQYLTHDQDSTGTRALLTATLVSDIQINLIYGARDTTINFPRTPLDSLKIRIITTDLQVYQTDGTIWVVTDQQDMFFRKGKVENGENPDYWWLYEWDELPTATPPGVGITPITWGGLKTEYGH